MTDANNCTAVGYSGTILRTNTGGIVTSTSGQTPGSSLFTLFQNHPNPFQSQTTISWQQAASSHVVLKVFDFMGREIRTLVDENRSPGEYQVTFNLNGYPPGVYFYQLQADGRVETKKMLIVR
jgi:hypothetical protein